MLRPSGSGPQRRNTSVFAGGFGCGHSSELAARGKLILQENCGRCHAIEAVGDSPLKKAPPMRDIYVRFAPRELQAELSEGMVSKHKEMPQIEFSDEDVYAIMTYLYSLAVRK